MGVKASFLNEIIKGKRPLTADIAVLLEKTLEIPAAYWMKFQSQYEIDNARIKEKNIKKIENIEAWKLIKEFVPVAYFKKKGHLTNNLESDIPKIKEIYNLTKISDLESQFKNRNFAFYRKSEKLQVDEKNLFAWSKLAMHEAKIQKVNSFSYENMPGLCNDLNAIFFENDNTIENVKSTLNQYGVKFVLVEKLTKTPVDGFSFWSGNNPAIALTLRHNRIDNFAFTLMHEIAHIELHLKNDKEKSFLDLTSKDTTSACESEADQFAQNKLISAQIWNNISQTLLPYNDHKIFETAKQYKINPAIILGRICHDINSYVVKTKIDKSLN